MALSPTGTNYNNAFLPSGTLNSGVSASNNNSKTNGSNNSYYAKKGEPMYMKEMDADDDGVVTFDEFKDYCKEKGISTKEMTKMVQMADSYRELMNQTQKNDKKSPIDTQVNDLLDKINSKNDNKIYAVRGDDKYNEAMDSNGDDKITYKEYIDYCLEHAKTNEQKSNTKVEYTQNGEFKTTNAGKAAGAYARSESQPLNNMYEYIA
jgi:hypothetical protein